MTRGAASSHTTAATAVTTRTRDGVRLARDYLHAHVTEQVGLAELASVAGVNKFALLRAFGRDVGIPPHAYLMRLRLALARHLIDRGEPLSHVAFDVGFADQSHLTRRFKGLFGTTPGAYARRGGVGALRNAAATLRQPHVARIASHVYAGLATSTPPAEPTRAAASRA